MRRGPKGQVQTEHRPCASASRSSLCERGEANLSRCPGAQASSCFQGPLALLPPNWQTLPSWCDPRARSTACSFRLIRLPGPHPGPPQSYPPLLFKGVLPTQIYVFVCSPVCLSQSLPIPVSQLPFLSRSFSESLSPCDLKSMRLRPLQTPMPQLVAFLQRPRSADGLELQTPVCTTARNSAGGHHLHSGNCSFPSPVLLLGLPDLLSGQSLLSADCWSIC